ncbi:MAG: DUF805 domain-containing protein [Gammaproteobacteria bacterium]|nr:DUF805 domain-containing protein [Gammaproteobacteria bacterium]MBU1490836.1 DUF805 domain-containing protein [Gammaproteobacteria bacterium]MBU2066906.1 DUF805 domain-containing protein [Gammaproteobacteria bacterium]MBU2137314.1 DUF805 domain-containing protein [Gammaproteobacteria bacterium]MBU2217483.1 DUF805 domain-containing protein [Gammaproteobacteria bacterium]
MAPIRYKIVFDGELMPEMALETVKDNLARLFKSDRARINSLFKGGAIALKRDLTDEEAEHYLAALQRAGACVRKEQDMAANLSLVAADTAPIAPSTSLPEMSCPKCAHRQPKSPECMACGIIIDKYLARQAQLAEQTPAQPPATAQPSAAAHPYATPRADVAEALPEVSELKVFSINGRIGRLRYLAWSLVMMAAFVAVMGVVGIAAALSEIVGGLLTIVSVVAMLVISVQIGAQRLHDIGWSAWLLLLNLVPLVNSVFWLLMLLIPGNDGANRYGPPAPPNSLPVKILAGLFIALMLGSIIALFLGGFAMLAMGLAMSGLDFSSLSSPSN